MHTRLHAHWEFLCLRGGAGSWGLGRLSNAKMQEPFFCGERVKSTDASPRARRVASRVTVSREPCCVLGIRAITYLPPPPPCGSSGFTALVTTWTDT